MADTAIPVTSPYAGLALASGAAALTLWAAVLAAQAPRLMAMGVICGESRGLLDHCAACLPAAALTLLALGFGFAATRRLPAPTNRTR